MVDWGDVATWVGVGVAILLGVYNWWQARRPRAPTVTADFQVMISPSTPDTGHIIGHFYITPVVGSPGIELSSIDFASPPRIAARLHPSDDGLKPSNMLIEGGHNLAGKWIIDGPDHKPTVRHIATFCSVDMSEGPAELKIALRFRARGPGAFDKTIKVRRTITAHSGIQ